MQRSNLPNFLIIGAPKCGTTSLYHYMSQHPEVFFSKVKEPQYFAFAGEKPNYKGPGVSVNSAVTDLNDYRKLFVGAGDAKAIGESSALYMSSIKASLRIKDLIPDARLIAILRNPVDRAFSSYMHLRRDGREPIDDFLSAVAAEETRISENWGFLWRYKQLGFYHAQLQRYYDNFDREQILVLLHEDLQNDSAATFQKIFNHLRISTEFQIDTGIKYNVSGIPRSRWAYDLVTREGIIKKALKKIIPADLQQKVANSIRQRVLRREKLDNVARNQLLDVFRSDIIELEKMLQRDLSNWMN